MPVRRFKRWEKIPTEETPSHQVFSMSHKRCHPIYVLAGGQAELKLDMVEEVKRVPTKGIKPFSGYLDQ